MAAYMSLRPLARSTARLRTLVSGFMVSLVACADVAQRAGAETSSEKGAQTAARDSAPRAPVDTVDSLEALRRATVLDVSPLRPQLPPATPTARAATDTTPPRLIRGSLGRAAGARHMAFRDAGSDLDSLWPVKGPAPLPGSILPAKRIIAFYGNPLSTRMGILGAIASDDMLRKLDAEVAAWNRIDPATPCSPRCISSCSSPTRIPGTSGQYRTRHDSAMIEKVYGWAKSRNAILFLDLQVGRSTLQYELPWIEKFLIRPDVHLGIDPEFSMKSGGVPGQRIGTFDAADINYATRFLANLVEKHRLPPKILVVHRFTPARRDEREEDHARSARAVRDAHGRLRRAVAEARHLLARHQARARAVHRVEAVHEGAERQPADAAR